MMMPITFFGGEFAFLSNFHPCTIAYEGHTYGSLEAAFQAAKTLDRNQRIIFTRMHAGQSKRAGRRLQLRVDWEDVKLQVMTDLLRIKFAPGTEMEAKLLSTRPRDLVEGNTWGDTYWGVCRGVGHNHLGKLLVKVRDGI